VRGPGIPYLQSFFRGGYPGCSTEGTSTPTPRSSAPSTHKLRGLATRKPGCTRPTTGCASCFERGRGARFQPWESTRYWLRAHSALTECHRVVQPEASATRLAGVASRPSFDLNRSAARGSPITLLDLIVTAAGTRVPGVPGSGGRARGEYTTGRGPAPRFAVLESGPRNRPTVAAFPCIPCATPGGGILI